MSQEPEDSLLEEALRNDLPSRDTETRLRRRLLAAGVAVGNGIATTTAAAGTAVSGTAATGFVAKVAGLSWGIKLGFAAVVAIPTVGLWLDSHGERRAAEPAVVAHARAVEPQTPNIAAKAELQAPAGDVQTEAAAPEPERGVTKAVKPGAEAAAHLAASDGAPDALHPSQADFGASEVPARTPQVPSTLAEETRLLDAAFAALAAGERARARELIQEHEARYPNGLLQKERERARRRLSEMSRGE